MKHKQSIVIIFFLALACLLPLFTHAGEPDASVERLQQPSDHFDGNVYFNPGVPQAPSPPPGREQKRSRYRWIWRWMFSGAWPNLPDTAVFSPGPPPVARVEIGALTVTPIGHATFLIQMDGLNILIDPIWSERCGPVSWVGPKRHKEPGIRFEDLPPIDVVLVSHNHYDHLDLPTLTRLAEKGTPRAVVPLGNRELTSEAGIPSVDALDWWESVRLSPDVTVTLVPAQHFSSRTLWDRNRTLWGGFVISGPSGNVFHSGDTGYGPHFREVARRFSPIRVALLPISPFRPRQSQDAPSSYYTTIHTGPADAVQAHLDLGAQMSIAGHFQVFQLGTDGFDDAVKELASTLKERHLQPDAFIAPIPGQAIEPGAGVAEVRAPARFEKLSVYR
jgi:L-ascorbate metabolism protein UlaG (beta-lactamase superfamily)